MGEIKTKTSNTMLVLMIFLISLVVSVSGIAGNTTEENMTEVIQLIGVIIHEVAVFMPDILTIIVYFIIITFVSGLLGVLLTLMLRSMAGIGKK